LFEHFRKKQRKEGETREAVKDIFTRGVEGGRASVVYKVPRLRPLVLLVVAV
jgi:hypothetical protein